MRFQGLVIDGVRHIGVVRDGAVYPVGTADEFYRDPSAALSAPVTSKGIPAAEVAAAPPVPVTSRIFCVGINYREHAEEAVKTAGLEKPKYPMIFGRWESTLVVDGTPIPLPLNEGLDWEVELAAIIGSKAWATTPDTALAHVLGYTAFNDVSARTKQLQTPQFTLGKNPDLSGPIGPVVVTTDEFSEPVKLRLQTRVNGETVQDSNTAYMINSVAEIIAYITDTVTLLPGDVIATGTPSGVGLAMDPPRFLKAGDVVEIELEGIGTLRNPIVASTQRP
jgi:2,4-didehydro-3-deoxy-L-rhamnonate hydrolase